MDLIFDFKTVSHELQLYPVRLACQLVNGEKLLNQASIIISPGVSISRVVYNVHDTSNEFAELYGLPPHAAAGIFVSFLLKAERIVAHNVDFNISIAEAMICRGKLEFKLDKFREIPRVCTMKSTTGLLKLPGQFGYRGPTLNEAYRNLIDKNGIDAAHDAVASVRACHKILNKLETMNVNLVGGSR